jgi:DNA-binding NarL/FixJ family response regulator
MLADIVAPLGGVVDGVAYQGTLAQVGSSSRPDIRRSTRSQDLAEQRPGQLDPGRSMTPMSAVVRVLLCDDHLVVREGLSRLLDGYPRIEVVGKAADGLEAVQAARELDPDVILMDLQMPNLDGVEATRRIVAANPATRVLVLTSFSEGDRVRAAIEAGAAGYLLKDTHPDELIRAIETVARGESPIDPRAARAFIDHGRQVRPDASLKPREREVLQLLGAGLSNKVIAMRLGISEATVKAYLTQIYRQIGVADRTQAALYASSHDFRA